MFSSRTNWRREHNRLAELLAARRKGNKLIYDLTVSNPTDCGFSYPETEILSAIAQPTALSYQPDPQGLLSARESIAQHYREKNIIVETSSIFLTASTSESYSLIFRLLCNGNENVLVPQPSYPLFEYLAQISDVDLQHYHLLYDHGWQIDVDSMTKVITPSTRGIVIVNPHNPTGTFLKKGDYERIREIAYRHRLALIVDEVFIDFALEDDNNRFGSTARETDILTFTLNGISKTIGLPQMKLGWIIVNGESLKTKEASERLEILCDTFLSVNSPVQVALPNFFDHGKYIYQQILRRIIENYDFLLRSLRHSACSVLNTEGGWYAILQFPRTKSDEAWTIELLSERGIYLFPGYYFDFQMEGFAVVSLITPPDILATAITSLREHVSKT